MVFKYSIALFIILKLVDTQIYRLTSPAKSKFTVTGAGRIHTIDPSYNPNDGYEPYWPGGNWVLSTGHTPPTDKRFAYNMTVTANLPAACGIPCNYMLASTGPVCGRWLNWTRVFCDRGSDGQQLCRKMAYMRSFENYCYFLAVKCNTHGYSKMIFEYFGECVSYFDDIYRPVYNREVINTRLPDYFRNLSLSLNNAPPIPKWKDGKQLIVRTTVRTG